MGGCKISDVNRCFNGYVPVVSKSQSVLEGTCGTLVRVWQVVLTLILQEREAEFRDQSETTNARVVRWTLIQLVVLGITCAWQLSHLRSFFIKQKLT